MLASGAENSFPTMKIVDTLLERGIYPSQRIVRDAPDRVGLSLANPAPRCLQETTKDQIR